jgi:hypothetical protein
MLMLGDLSPEILVPVYKEFQCWKIILHREFQVYLMQEICTLRHTLFEILVNT